MKKNRFIKVKKSSRKNQKTDIVVIIGLGYVGLPLACLCAEKGYRTFGIAKDRKRLNMINNGHNPLSDDQSLNEIISRKIIKVGKDYNNISKSDIIVICVPTPVDEFYNPDLEPIKQACRKVAKHLKKGQLIIIESTISPGVCEEVIKPILENTSNYIAGKDFFLAHCPERINPGDSVWNVKNIPRVAGAISKKGLQFTLKFYKNILDGQIIGMKSIKEAEASKIIENSFRDINIAFVNELAKSFDILGIDLVDVIKGASTKPFAFMPHWPSLGVGGHCIPVDPYYLIERARLAGFDHTFLKLARKINNSMPEYAVNLLVNSLNQLGKSIKNSKVGVLGLSYKANICDLRESPSLRLISILKDRGADLEVFDPYFPDKSTVNSMNDILKKSQALVIATNHREFVNIDVSKFKRHGIKVIVDGKNCLNKEVIQKMGIIYKGIGR